MSLHSYSQTSALDLAQNIREKKVSAQEVVQAYFKYAKTADAKIGAFLNFEETSALKKAKEVDDKIAQGQTLGLLAGVPIAIKDNICVENSRTTCASRMLENFVSPYDATVIKKLKEADAVFIGKTNMDEFAMGSSTENSAFQVTHNPWDISRIPGGSSGGSAAALAARMCSLSLGSDTGGSIRQPASLCGVMGLKPTYGRVSRFGLVAFASSLDQIGPFATSAQDCAALLQVISGYDPLDSTSAKVDVPNFLEEMKKPLNGLKLGLPKEFFLEGLDAGIKDSVMAAVEVYKSLGASVQEISLPNSGASLAVYYILAPSEASSNLARYDGVRYGARSQEAGNLLELYEKSRSEFLGAEVKRRIMLGTYALSSGYYDAFYSQAQKVRTLICQDFENAYKQVDVIVTPTVPAPAFKVGEKSSDPLQMYLSDIYTISCNLAGVPGLSIPCGFSAKLPVGLQLLARPFEESRLLQMAWHYQQKTHYHQQEPS